MRQAKKVCKEMVIGLFVWMIPVLVVLTIIATHRFAMILGVLAGSAVAIGMLWHMVRHLDIALDMDAKHAQSHVQISAMKRMCMMAAILIVSMLYPHYMHPIGVVCGLYGMKISALLYPKLHPVIERYHKQKWRRLHS